MSKYTTELRYVLQSLCGIETPYREVIENSHSKLFDFQYPLSSVYKEEFETLFCRRYYMREIGSETSELFKLRLEDLVCITAEKYNKLLKSQKFDYDFTVSSIVTENREKSGTTESNEAQNTENQTSTVTNTGIVKSENNTANTNNGSVNTENTKNKFSDTPTYNLSDVTNMNYLTNYTEIESTKNGNNNSSTITQGSSSINDNTSKNSTNTTESGKATTQNKKEETLASTKYTGNINKLRMEYENSIRNIFNEWLDELEILFMLIY